MRKSSSNRVDLAKVREKILQMIKNRSNATLKSVHCPFALTMEEICAGTNSTQVKEDFIGEHRSITAQENQSKLNEMKVHF